MNHSFSRSISGPAKDARKLLRPLRRDLLGWLQRLLRVNTVAIPPNDKRNTRSNGCNEFLLSNGIRSELCEIELGDPLHGRWKRKARPVFIPLSRTTHA
jgi:hypothetical protein